MTYLGSVYTRNKEKVAGDVLLTLGGGLVHGLITTPAGVYQLVPAKGNNSGAYRLQKMRQIAAGGITDFPEPNVVENQSVLRQSITSAENSTFAMSSTCCTVDLLVLYTPDARWNKGGTTAITNWINTIVASHNQKLAEVGLNSYSLSLKAAKETSWPTFSVPYHENSTHNGLHACLTASGQQFCDSIIADQYWVSTNATVASLRNQYSSDLVVLITANSRKHPSDVVHGFADLKNDGVLPQTHGTIGANNDCYTVNGFGRDCGEFVTVRDSFALSNLTFHHEVGHAFGLKHDDGAITFGFYSNGSEQQASSNQMKPFTIMKAQPPICLWSAPWSSSSCHVRMPFYTDMFQFRIVYHSAFPTPRKFTPTLHAEPLIMNGMSWLHGQR
jgi:hypothetical protein